MKKTKLVIMAVLVSFLVITGIFGVTLTGTVTDAKSGAPIAGVLVLMDKYEGRYPGFTIEQYTDASGKYSIQQEVTGIAGATRVLAPAGNQLLSVYTVNGRMLYSQLTEKELHTVKGKLLTGVYLVSRGNAQVMTIVKAGGEVMVSKTPAAAKAAQAAGLQTDTLVSFSKDGYTTGWTLKDGNSFNIKLHPRTALGTRPWKGNTGPTGPLRMGGGSAIKSGQVASGYYFGGTLNISATNVTIKNFVINAGGLMYGVSSTAKGLILEDGEIVNASSSGTLGAGMTMRRLNIHDTGGDGTKVQGGDGTPSLVEYCYIHRLGKNDGAHADGNQTRGGSNITFRYNNIYMPNPGTPTYPGTPYKSNATFMLQLTIKNFLIEKNWLTGGNYCIYSSGGVSVKNNIFGRYNGGYPTKEELRIKNGTFSAWSGNVWEDTGTSCP